MEDQKKRIEEMEEKYRKKKKLIEKRKKSTEKRKKRIKKEETETNLENRPRGGHSSSMIIGPPLEILGCISILDRVSVFFIDDGQFGIIGDVEATVDGEEDFFEEEESLLFKLLTLLKHFPHLLTVLLIII